MSSLDFLYRELSSARFDQWVSWLKAQHREWFSPAHHGDFQRWDAALRSLPNIDIDEVLLDDPAVTISAKCTETAVLKNALLGLSPWRKGPYRIADVFIDTEWRSDLKWDRISPHLAPLADRRILDVGCGNGYHCWRMLGEAPRLVLGVDPSLLFNLQFRAVQHYIQDPRIHLLPIGIQHLPSNMQWFDTVFSMGVLYHRKSPIEHLQQLRALLRPGGELCLETLVIPGGPGQVLVPAERYARMNNVWFLPSADELLHWMERCGWRDCRLIDVNRTTTEEQRSTEWMKFESLPQCLDPDDPEATVEGYPAPRRAVIMACK
jgi:tRNA (mo5U34)-methyltransferase